MKVKIVFTEPSNTSIFGKFVIWAIGGRFSHVHFLFDGSSTTWTYEAYPPRVRLFPKDLYPGQGVTIDLPFNHSQAIVLKNQAILESQTKVYSANDALRIFIRNRVSRPLARWLGKWLHADKGETCSTLAVRTLRLMWPEFGGKDALEFSPDEVYQALMKLQESGW